MTSAASAQPATVAAGPCLQDTAPQPPAAPPTNQHHNNNNYRNHFPANNSRLHGHRNHNYHQHHHHNHHNHHHNHGAGFMSSVAKGPAKGSHTRTATTAAALNPQQQVLQPVPANDFRNACSSSASSSSLHSSDCSSANSTSAGQSHRPQPQHHPLPVTTPPGPPYYVDLHVNAGEIVSLQLFGGQEQLVAGPTTVTMISQQQNPPVPIPVQVPPGHMIHQIADENGILKHIILSLETDDGPQLDSTVINLPQGAFRMDPNGELVSIGASAPAAGGLTNLPDQAYFANYDGYRAQSMLVMGNNYAPVYSGYEQHTMPTTTTMDARVASTSEPPPVHLAQQPMHQAPLVAGGYRLTDSGDIDNYNNPQHMGRGNRELPAGEASEYNGHGGKSYSQASARHSEMKRQQYQSTSSDKLTSSPVSSGKFTNSTNVKVISNNHIASNKNGVQPPTTAYHHHNHHHQQQHLNNNSNSNSNSNHHHHHNNNNNQQHHQTNNQAPNPIPRASRIKGSPHNQSIQNTGKQQHYGTSNSDPMHNAKDHMLTANHQTNFHHSNSSSANHLKSSNNNNDSISSNNSNNNASCNNSKIVHPTSDNNSANKSSTNQVVEPDNKSSLSRNKPRVASSTNVVVVESNSTEPQIHKSKSFDNSSPQDSSSSPTSIKQQILVRQKSIPRNEKHIIESENGSESLRVIRSSKDKSTSRAVSLNSQGSESARASNAPSVDRTHSDTSTCQENIKLDARTSRGKQKCQMPQDSHSQDARSSNKQQPTLLQNDQTNHKPSSPRESSIRKRSDTAEIHETIVKTTTPEASTSNIVGGKSRQSGESTERQQKGKQRSTKDKSAATKQTSETIEAMKLEAATMIACDKKDKSDSPSERVDTSDEVQETVLESSVNIQPATKVKAIKVEEQRNLGTSMDSGSQIDFNHQAKHKNQKHNITSNNLKTMDAVASNKQLHQQHEQQQQPSKKSKSTNGSKQVVKRGRQNNQSLKELHQFEQQADTSLVLSSASSTSSGGHRGYPSSHSSSNSNHHNHQNQHQHQNGSSSAGKSSAPQPVKLTNLIRQCRTKVARLLVRLVKSSLSSCSDTKFVTVLLILFTCIATLLAMCIHSFIAAPVTE